MKYNIVWDAGIGFYYHETGSGVPWSTYISSVETPCADCGKPIKSGLCRGGYDDNREWVERSYHCGCQVEVVYPTGYTALSPEG